MSSSSILLNKAWNIREKKKTLSFGSLYIFYRERVKVYIYGDYKREV